MLHEVYAVTEESALINDVEDGEISPKNVLKSMDTEIADIQKAIYEVVKKLDEIFLSETTPAMIEILSDREKGLREKELHLLKERARLRENFLKEKTTQSSE
jgi:hypothetical protein